VNVPAIDWPAVGDLIETEGGTVSLERTVNKTEDELVLNTALTVAD
jgi:hypothetical protein